MKLGRFMCRRLATHSGRFVPARETQGVDLMRWRQFASFPVTGGSINVLLLNFLILAAQIPSEFIFEQNIQEWSLHPERRGTP
ncbi:MAG TPA: hypothetical protein VED86_01385 [archaeon]|nr:hypothetical protein [archaeon]